MDRGAWGAAVHGVAKSWTRLSDFTFTFHFHALEKEMATHSSVLAWRIPGMGEPGGLPSMGLHRVGHDWSDLAAALSGSRVSLDLVIELRRRLWHPIPVLLPGKSHGWRSLVGCSPWVAKSWTWLSDFTFTFHFHALEKETATHSSVLAWRIPGTGEPGGLPSMGSHRVKHNWRNLEAAAAAGRESRKRQSPAAVLPLMCFKYCLRRPPWREQVSKAGAGGDEAGKRVGGVGGKWHSFCD